MIAMENIPMFADDLNEVVFSKRYIKIINMKKYSQNVLHDIFQVRIAMNSGSTRQMYVYFDAKGTSCRSWMSQAKIVDSSCTDIILNASHAPDYFKASG